MYAWMNKQKQTSTVPCAFFRLIVTGHNMITHPTLSHGHQSGPSAARICRQKPCPCRIVTLFSWYLCPQRWLFRATFDNRERVVLVEGCAVSAKPQVFLGKQQICWVRCKSCTWLGVHPTTLVTNTKAYFLGICFGRNQFTDFLLQQFYWVPIVFGESFVSVVQSSLVRTGHSVRILKTLSVIEVWNWNILCSSPEWII